MYDFTTGYIVTPGGKGKFIEYDGNTQKVTVLMDFEYEVEFDGDECYVV